MPSKTIPSKEVTRRCLRRIQKWNRVKSFDCQERDWTFFLSEFPEVEVTCSEVMRALEILNLSGHITLSFPRGHFDPDFMRIQLATHQEVR